MGRKRKIPARKHHGIRDPLKQLKDREKRLSSISNNPPTAAENTQFSYKFSQLKRSIEETKAGKRIKRIAAGRQDKPKSIKNGGQKYIKNVNEKHFQKIKQFVGEDDDDYLRRVNRITKESVIEAQYESKYGVNVIRDPKTGEITVKKRPKNEIDELLKKKQREQRLNRSQGNRQKKMVENILNQLDASSAKKIIQQAIKEGNDEHIRENDVNSNALEYKRDLIQFGEIVHAPPTILTIPSKAKKNETVPRPGKKGNLLLQGMIIPRNADVLKFPAHKKSQNESSGTDSLTKIQMRGKRRDLPLVTRKMLDSERKKMVNLYRQLKKPKC